MAAQIVLCSIRDGVATDYLSGRTLQDFIDFEKVMAAPSTVEVDEKSFASELEKFAVNYILFGDDSSTKVYIFTFVSDLLFSDF